MNTFLPYPNILASVKCLDNKRLGKQRVEAKQILKALTQGPEIAYKCDISEKIERKESLWFQPLDSGDGIRKTPWYNHPATQMWKGYTNLLELYRNECIYEWIRRGFRNTMFLTSFDVTSTSGFCTFEKPTWWGSPIHDTHKSNLLRKDSEWYSQFDWQVPNDLAYIWPTN